MSQVQALLMAALAWVVSAGNTMLAFLSQNLVLVWAVGSTVLLVLVAAAFILFFFGLLGRVVGMIWSAIKWVGRMIRRLIYWIGWLLKKIIYWVIIWPLKKIFGIAVAIAKGLLEWGKKKLKEGFTKGYLSFVLTLFVVLLALMTANTLVLPQYGLSGIRQAVNDLLMGLLVLDVMLFGLWIATQGWRKKKKKKK